MKRVKITYGVQDFLGDNPLGGVIERDSEAYARKTAAEWNAKTPGVVTKVVKMTVTTEIEEI